MGERYKKTEEHQLFLTMQIKQKKWGNAILNGQHKHKQTQEIFGVILKAVKYKCSRGLKVFQPIYALYMYLYTTEFP